MIKNLIILTLLISTLFSNDNVFKIGDKEKPSISNNFDSSSYIFTSNNPASAALLLGVGLLFNNSKSTKTKEPQEKIKKFNTNFDYLYEFETKVKDKYLNP